MNQTNIEHAVIAALITAVVGFLSGNYWIGAALAIGVFIGREHAQREYKIGDPSKLYGYEAFDFWRWSLDSKLDLIFPVVMSVVIALIL